ncbi:hypothetical protein BH24ACT11_BH24ACT11_11390 [soil metagenome]
MVLVLDAAGWIGGVFVTVGYVLVSIGQLTATSRRFQMLNVAGGVLLTGTALYRGALPNTIINIVWIVFGVYALVSRRGRHETDNDSEPDGEAADKPDQPRPLSSAPSAVADRENAESVERDPMAA